MVTSSVTAQPTAPPVFPNPRLLRLNLDFTAVVLAVLGLDKIFSILVFISVNLFMIFLDSLS